VYWVNDTIPAALWNAGRDRRLDELPGGRQYRVAHRDAERAGGIVRGGVDDDVLARRQALALAEIRQYLGVAPAGGAAFGPGVEVARMAAHIHHVVDAGRAAEHLAARHRDASLVEAQPGLAGIGGEHPVGRRVKLHRRRRYRQRRDLGRPLARLDQRHSARGIFGEPRGDHCPGRAATNDDKIEFLSHGIPPCSMRSAGISVRHLFLRIPLRNRQARI
jgi:hypothetical protein